MLDTKELYLDVMVPSHSNKIVIQGNLVIEDPDDDELPKDDDNSEISVLKARNQPSLLQVKSKTLGE